MVFATFAEFATAVLGIEYQPHSNKGMVELEEEVKVMKSKTYLETPVYVYE